MKSLTTSFAHKFQKLVRTNVVDKIKRVVVKKSTINFKSF